MMAELDDIIGILEAVDILNQLSTVMFVAANLEAMPRFGPEEINVAAVVERQTRVEATVKNIVDSIQQLVSTPQTTPVTVDAAADVSVFSVVQSNMNDLQMKFDSFASSVNARLDHLHTVFQSSLASATGRVNNARREDYDRSSNIIIFGVPEDRDISIWRRKIDDILQFVCGRPVDLVDVLRLGRFRSDKTRPILVKLRVAWDKRLLLSNCFKLKQYGQKGVFLSADEPPEVRRKQTFDRLKYRAERENKQVVINNDILFIDGNAVFSLRDGFIGNGQNV
jgi:hypothetical protein